MYKNVDLLFKLIPLTDMYIYNEYGYHNLILKNLVDTIRQYPSCQPFT